MPLLWRYLLSQYLKVFLLCVVSFVAILLTMRLEEIANFATLGPQIGHIAWFVLQQVPYILPIAIPFSSLIASILLMQNLSQSHEITAMRACGFAVRDIITPVLLAALFLSATNFYVISELSTTSHLQTGLLKSQLRSINPLLLLHNKHIMRIKGFHFDALGGTKIGEYSEDVLFFSPGKRDGRIAMMTAKRLEAIPEKFVGEGVTLISSMPSKSNSQNESFIIENIAKSTTAIQDFSEMLEKKIWYINNDHLRLPQLLVRMNIDKQEMQRLKETNADKNALKQATTTYYREVNEILKRISAALAVFTFTLMGIAFGINISRNRSNRGIIYIIALGALYLVAFFAAKSFDMYLKAGILLLFLPHLVICGASLWTLRRTVHGVE